VLAIDIDINDFMDIDGIDHTQADFSDAMDAGSDVD
jgi:hypothetical protein